MAYALMGGLVAVASVLAGCFVFCLHRWFRSGPTKVVPSQQHAPAKRIRPRERDDERTRLLKESSEESENGEGDKKPEPAFDTSEQLIASTPVDIADVAAEKPSSRADDKVSTLRQSDSTRRDSYGSTDTTGVEAVPIKPAPLVVTATSIGEKKDERGGVAGVGEGVLEPAGSKEDGRGKAESSTVSAEVEPALIDLEAAGATVRDLEVTTKEDDSLGDVFSAPVIPPAQGEGDKKQVGVFEDEEARSSHGTTSSARTDLEGSKGFGDSVAVLSTIDQEEGKSGILFTKRVESVTSPTVAGSAPAETAKESVADKLTTLTQPTLVEAQREEREASEDTQTVPKLPPPPKVSPKPSPLARAAPKPTPSPQIAPKPSPRPKRPSPNSSTSPDPSSTPVVPDKPAVQPRKLPKGAVPLFPGPKGGVPVFPGIPKGAVPVLPIGGFPALRKTGQGDSDNSSEVRSSGHLRAGPWMGNGSSAGSEGQGEIGTSFEEPIKAPDLYSPSKDRVRGPANRRRPSRH